METLFLFMISLFGINKDGCLELDIMLVADLSGNVYRNEYFVADGRPNRRNTALETILQLRTIYDLSVCGVWIGGDY